MTRVRVRWPDGSTDAWPLPGVDRWLTVQDGRGIR
jgi:hypothetical protein